MGLAAVSVLVLIAQGNLLKFWARCWAVGAVLPAFAMVTIIFAVLDIGDSKFRLLERATKATNEQFNPRTLPALRPASDFPGGKPISRFKTAFELFFSVAFLLWWVRVNPIRKLALFLALGLTLTPFQWGRVEHHLQPVIFFRSYPSCSRSSRLSIHRIKFYSQ
jgi:hypothetical protein